MTFKESPGCCAELAWLLAKYKLRAQLRVWPTGPGFVERERNPIRNPTLGLQWASEAEGSRCWALLKLLKNVYSYHVLNCTPELNANGKSWRMGREIPCGSGHGFVHGACRMLPKYWARGGGRWLQLSIACCMLNPMEPAGEQELGRHTRRMLAWWHGAQFLNYPL